MKNHLAAYNQKKFGADDGTNVKEKRIMGFLKSSSSNESFKKLTDIDKKMVHARKLVLLACESYIPFNALVSSGFKRFMLSYGAKLEHFPTDRTLLGTALDDVYQMCLSRVKSMIKNECPLFCSMSTDGWTDSHLGNSYINYNLIYYISDKIKTLLLEVAPYKEVKSGENLCDDYKRVIKEFNISDRKFFIVNDSATNNTKAYKVSKADPDLNIVGRIGCIAHHIHNLVYTDIFKSSDKEFQRKGEGLKSLMNKLSAIHKGCYYKKTEMTDVFKTFCSEEKWNKILQHDKDFSDFDWESMFPEKEPSLAPKLSTSNSTRWSATLSMLRSFLPLVSVLNRILCDNKKYTLMITDEETQTIQDLVEIFQLFEEAVNVCQVCL